MARDDAMTLPVQSIRNSISALQAGSDLIYLDSAATALVPDVLQEASSHYYRDIHAAVHRTACPRAEQATQSYEQARSTIARLLHAHPDELVFTAGTTAGIHLVIQSVLSSGMRVGDRILLNPLEHHSNLLPWQRFAQERGITIDWAVVDDQGYVNHARTLDLIGPRTKLVAWALASHIIGVYEDTFWQQMVARAHAVGALIVGDASQYIGHRELMSPYTQCDVLVCSAHKMMGPTGIGAVRILRKHHGNLQPWMLGGGMVESASQDGSCSWARMPYLLEAGTPATAQAYMWAAVIDWQKKSYNLSDLAVHEAALIAHAVARLEKIPGIRVIMPAHVSGQPTYSHLVSFYHDTLHAHDIAHVLGQKNICVRAGTLCAQPAMARLGTPAVIRISVHAYSTVDDINTCIDALEDICGG